GHGGDTRTYGILDPRSGRQHHGNTEVQKTNVNGFGREGRYLNMRVVYNPSNFFLLGDSLRIWDSGEAAQFDMVVLADSHDRHLYLAHNGACNILLADGHVSSSK